MNAEIRGMLSYLRANEQYLLKEELSLVHRLDETGKQPSETQKDELYAIEKRVRRNIEQGVPPPIPNARFEVTTAAELHNYRPRRTNDLGE